MIALTRALLFLSLAGPVLLLDPTTSPVCVVAFALLCGATFIALDGNALRQLGSRSRPAIAAAGIILTLLLLQLAPWMPEALTHPIWKTASAALEKQLGNRITLDPGGTIGNAIQLLFLMSALVTTAACCGDPRKARLVHRWICIAVYLTCAFVIVLGWFEPGRVDPGQLPALAIAALITATSLLLHGGREAIARNQALPELLLAICGILLGIGALAVAQLVSAGVVAIAGVTLTALASWLPGARFPARAPILPALAVTLLLVGFSMFVPRLLTDTAMHLGSVDPDATAPVRRMMSDTPVLGTGGGTFSTLAQIYARDSSEPLRPPSLAAKLYVEYGAAGSATIAFVWLVVGFELLAGAMRRMRDRHLCASAAALSLAIAVEAFLDTSGASAPFQLLVAMLLGVGLAQREPSAR